jgi:hypothetical protein
MLTSIATEVGETVKRIIFIESICLVDGWIAETTRVVCIERLGWTAIYYYSRLVQHLLRERDAICGEQENPVMALTESEVGRWKVET